MGAITQGDDGYPIVDHDKCIECGKCVRSCPKKAMQNRRV
ncbi:4Fe-4S binding protein [uncultured Muribaculum sp.]|nr:4Fe-4S binding protein [uncultured Muribaculum sp.]